MPPSIAVVIPVYNRTDLLGRTLAGLAAQSHRDFDVIVADDGSEEDVKAAVDSWVEKLRVRTVRRERDGYGAGQARNLGAEASDAEVIVFIDADCLPDPDLTANHLRWHADHLDRVVIGSRHQLDTSDLSEETIASGQARLRQLAFGSTDPDLQDLSSADYRRVLHRRTGGLRKGDEAFRSLVSSNFSVRRSRFLEVGGFSEAFHRWGGEDTELGWRLQNRGLEFVADDEAIIYHQTQVDAGPEGWRTEARSLNRGLITTKIPHRFYRPASSGTIYEVPKVSIVVNPTIGARFPDLWAQLLRQRLTDWEVVAVDDGSEELAIVGDELSADPRFGLCARDLEAAIGQTRGEYVVFLHGLAGLDHRLLSRAVKRLDDHPAAASARTSYTVTTREGVEVFRRLEDLYGFDREWGGPVFAMVRRRDLFRLGGRSGLPELITGAGVEQLGDPLLAMPSHRPQATAPARVPPLTSDRSLFLDDLRRGPGSAVQAIPRFVRSRLARTPYREPAATRVARSPVEGRVRARYIGWSGHSNLGDEALLEAVRSLLAWADIATSGPAGQLLILGGGTLINRGYLRQVVEHDSPRVERVIFGTGVANPSYWGPPKEDPASWVEFLQSCGFVGVRGPTSAELIRKFGYRGPLEVIGDPALILTAPPVERVAGRVVVAPAFARGELWGGEDQVVFAALGEAVKRLLAEGREVHFLSCFPGDDRHIFETMRRAGHPDLPYLAGYDGTEAAMGLLASAEVVIAERLHAAVLAAAAGTPFVSLEYRPKLADFARSTEMEALLLRTDQATGEAILGRVKTLEADSEVGERLERWVTVYRSRLREAAARVEALVSSGGD